MDKNTKISSSLRHFIENSIRQTESNYTTGILAYENTKNNITECLMNRTDNGIDDLRLIPSPDNKFKPDIKVIIIILPYTEVNIKRLKIKDNDQI